MRGRNGQRKPTQRVTARKESNPIFKYFPVRQHPEIASGAKTNTKHPTTRQRFNARPTARDTQLFQGFDFIKPGTQQNRLNPVAEDPRGAFKLDQSYRGNHQNVIADQNIMDPAEPLELPAHLTQSTRAAQPSAPLQPQQT